MRPRHVCSFKWRHICVLWGAYLFGFSAEFQKVRATEHANGQSKRNKRAKGAMCLTPRDDALLPRLLDEDDRAALFRSAEEHRAWAAAQ